MAKESTMRFGTVCFWEVGDEGTVTSVFQTNLRELFDCYNRFLILGQSLYFMFLFLILPLFRILCHILCIFFSVISSWRWVLFLVVCVYILRMYVWAAKRLHLLCLQHLLVGNYLAVELAEMLQRLLSENAERCLRTDTIFTSPTPSSNP